MTREEAAQAIYGVIIGSDECEEDFCLFSDQVEALEMGIEALKQPKIIRCENCHYYDGEHCDMHNAGTYPTDYCSYAVWKYEEDET